MLEIRVIRIAVLCGHLMALFLFMGNLGHRIFMSAIIHVMGRVTKDPAMQQGKNNGSEYISLDLASSQRSQNTQNCQNGYESMFYQCYFNKFLAERLIKAGVKSGTCGYVY